MDIRSGDGPSEWPEAILTDPRVTEYWDGSQAVGRQFAETFGFEHGPVAYDVYYLFGSDATWDDSVPEVVSSGYTIVSERGSLTESLEAMLPNFAVQ